MALIAADKSKANSCPKSRKSPYACIGNSAGRLDTVNVHSTSDISVDSRHENSDSSTANDNLSLGCVAPEVPPHGLAQRGRDGIELFNLLILLGLSSRSERRKDECASSKAENESYG